MLYDCVYNELTSFFFVELYVAVVQWICFTETLFGIYPLRYKHHFAFELMSTTVIPNLMLRNAAWVVKVRAGLENLLWNAVPSADRPDPNCIS